MKKFSSRLALICGLMLLCGTTEIAVAAVANDNCANATAVGNVTNMAFDTTSATFDGPGHYITGRNIWFCYTASCSGTADISLFGSSFDTKIAVYNGCECYPSFDALLKANDDGQGNQAEVCVPVTAGNQYLIEVGGFGSAAGAGKLTISCDSNGQSPVNDDCQNAKQVGNVTNLSFNTTCATVDGLGLCQRLSNNIWYRYTATQTRDITVSLLGSEYDTSLAIYHAGACPPTSGDLIDCNDDFGDISQSQMTFAAVSGRSYLIEVGGYSLEDFGRGVLTISSSPVPPPPSSNNDDCVNARKVGDVTDLRFDTRQATFDGPGRCMSSPNLWYRYTATCSGPAKISLCGSEFDTMLAVYRGWQCYPKASDLLGCNDDACGSQSELTVNVIAGDNYLIEVGGYGSETGVGVLTIRCQGEPAGGDFDLGDAPDSSNNAGRAMTAYTHQGLLQVIVDGHFPTVFDDGSGTGPVGPVHMRPAAVAYLGELVTLETEADAGPDQDGSNNLRPSVDLANNDKGEDGVIFPITMPNCGWTTFDYTVQVIQPGTDLWVNVWCDWNRDGDWDDTLNCAGARVPEWAVQNQFLYNLPAGVRRITTPGILASHPKNGPDELWMRITLSEQPWKGGSSPSQRGNGGSGPQSKYDIGETEDYYFAPDMNRPLCEDFNGDGVVNTQDLVDLTAAWLAACPQ